MEKPPKDCLTIQVSEEDIKSPDFNLYNFLNKKFKKAWLEYNRTRHHFPFNNVKEL